MLDKLGDKQSERLLEVSTAEQRLVESANPETKAEYVFAETKSTLSGISGELSLWPEFAVPCGCMSAA